MSLDVYLTTQRDELPEAAKAAILLREHGFDEYASEIEARHDVYDHDTLYEANVTHNLTRMARAAGIYEVCWRPEEIGATKAKDIIEPLAAGVAWLERNPGEASLHNPSNGWGNYDGFLMWVRRYLDACLEHPEADIRVSR